MVVQHDFAAQWRCLVKPRFSQLPGSFLSCKPEVPIMKRTPIRPSPVQPRKGFSLIELMVAIVIIAILMALILPAIGAVRRRAQIGQTSAEITQLDQAIASFKAAYGIEPPSSLLIPAAGGTWDSISRSKIRSIWPQFDYDNRGGLPASAPAMHLNGAECLVFFLGGLESGSLASPSVIGFSKNPRTPWSTGGTNREGPFFEFDAGRFVDVDGDSLFEYIDPLPDQKTPYLYLSSQGKSYNKTNAGGASLAEQDDFDVHGGPANALDMLFCYVKSDGNTPQRANGYQIISPGLDATYGPGGVYNDGSELVDADLNANSTLEANEKRAVEADNITNFANGALRP